MYKSLANDFDQPIESDRHQELLKNAWIAGHQATMCYWLSRCVKRNLFYESKESVVNTLRQFLDIHCLGHWAPYVVDSQTWYGISIWLRDYAEVSQNIVPTGGQKLVAAINAYLRNPDWSDAQIAVAANTTEKQVKRMSEISALRNAWIRGTTS